MLLGILRTLGVPGKGASIHQDFQLHNTGFRCNWETTPRDLSIKARVGFTSARLLDNCPFYAKIGINTDRAISESYIGFMYGRHDEMGALVLWVQKFPFAELIEGLDRNGATTRSSITTRIT